MSLSKPLKLVRINSSVGQTPLEIDSGFATLKNTLSDGRYLEKKVGWSLQFQFKSKGKKKVTSIEMKFKVLLTFADRYLLHVRRLSSGKVICQQLLPALFSSSATSSSRWKQQQRWLGDCRGPNIKSGHQLWLPLAWWRWARHHRNSCLARAVRCSRLWWGNSRATDGHARPLG